LLLEAAEAAERRKVINETTQNEEKKIEPEFRFGFNPSKEEVGVKSQDIKPVTPKLSLK
jgi:hypothetical protein